MATEAITVDNGDLELCVLCSSKHNRDQSSICQCKHCSIALCLDCMREHHEEVLKDVSRFSHQYNELKELLQKQQLMIVEEINKSIANVNRQFEIYIEELRDNKQKILEDMDKTRQDAQEYVLKIETDLRILGGEIQELEKQGFVQTSKMKNLSNKLENTKKRLNTCQVSRTENLNKTKPEFSIKFDYSPVDVEKQHSTYTDIDINQILETDLQGPPLKKPRLDIFDCSWFTQPFSMYKLPEIDHLEFGSELLFNLDSIETEKSHIKTSYKVDRMASDGKNVLYTSSYGDDRHYIAYCHIDDNSGEGDQYQRWTRYCIKDMIWWSSSGTFICATYDGIYTVNYLNRNFKIDRVIYGEWSYIRVASNTDHLFLWKNSTENSFNGINVYSTQFKCIRTIDFNTHQIHSFADGSISFCVTKTMVASLCQHMENNCEVFQVIFYDMNMKKFNSVPLDRCYGNIEIRTDGDNRFFITTGRKRFYIVRSDGEKQEVNLKNGATRIAVFENQRIATSNGRANIELTTY